MIIRELLSMVSLPLFLGVDLCMYDSESCYLFNELSLILGQDKFPEVASILFPANLLFLCVVKLHCLCFLPDHL